MEWDDLKYVLATARSGSFLGAAHMLKVTHTTVGRRIKSLETDLGQQLFHRTRDGVEATELCLQLIPTAEDIEQKVREITMSVETREVQPEGRVRLHTAAWIIQHILIPAFPAFRVRFPKIQVFFVSDVVDSIIDPSAPAVSLRFDVMAKRNEIESRICDIPFSVYRAKDAESSRLQWATSHGGKVTIQTSEWLRHEGVQNQDIALLATDAEIVRQSILTGQFRGLLPDFLAKHDPRLVRENAGRPELTRQIRSIAARRSANTPIVRAVLDWSTNVVRQSQN